MTPATTVAAKRPAVTAGLASHTRRITRGSAALVPATACLRLRQRLRRSLGPCGSCGSSITGSPVRPLFAGPVCGFAERLRPGIQNGDGPPWPGGIIPTGLPYRRTRRRSFFESSLLLCSAYLAHRKASFAPASMVGPFETGGSHDQSPADRSLGSGERDRNGTGA